MFCSVVFGVIWGFFGFFTLWYWVLSGFWDVLGEMGVWLGLGFWVLLGVALILGFVGLFCLVFDVLIYVFGLVVLVCSVVFACF